MPKARILVTIVAVVITAVISWAWTYSHALKKQYQVVADVTLSNAGELLDIVGKVEPHSEAEEMLLKLLLQRVLLASTLPHEISNLNGDALVSLCHLITRSKMASPFGSTTDTKTTEIALQYLRDSEQLAINEVQKSQPVLPRGTCGI